MSALTGHLFDSDEDRHVIRGIVLLGLPGSTLPIKSDHSLFFANHLTELAPLAVNMADPVSVASGVLALAVFALQSSKALYQVIQSFQSNQRVIRELSEELETLQGVLKSLERVAANNTTDLQELKLPLERCDKACREFEVVITKCTPHSHGARTSFRDWAKLQYMGDDISGFKNTLAGYKSTISIALGSASL